MWDPRHHAVGDTLVVHVEGDLDIQVAGVMRKWLTTACESHRNLVLDLADVKFIDSTGLGALVRAHQAAKRNGGQVVLATPSRFLLTILQTMRLEPVFPTFPTAAAAVTYLEERAPELDQVLSR
jgi:anti-anti-sigma factor